MLEKTGVYMNYQGQLVTADPTPQKKDIHDLIKACSFCMNFIKGTVDGRNPAPVDMVNI